MVLRSNLSLLPQHPLLESGLSWASGQLPNPKSDGGR